MNRFIEILASLERHEVEYVIVGEMTAAIHGMPAATMNLATLVRVSEENVSRLMASLAEIGAVFRTNTGAVILPQPGDILAGHHLMLRTHRGGTLDVLPAIGRPPRRFDDMRDQIVTLDVYGLTIPILGLAELIRQKRALGRDKDLVALRMLEEVARQRGIDPGG